MMNILKLLAMVAVMLANTYVVKADDTLYQQLGGQEAIALITTKLLDRILTNPKIDFLFKETDREDLHKKIVDQICMETGGPCQYEGLDMVEAHSGMEIKYSEYDVFVEDFILAMEDADIHFRVQNKVLAIFAPMREDVTHQ